MCRQFFPSSIQQQTMAVNLMKSRTWSEAVAAVVVRFDADRRILTRKEDPAGHTHSHTNVCVCWLWCALRLMCLFVHIIQHTSAMICAHRHYMKTAHRRDACLSACCINATGISCNEADKGEPPAVVSAAEGHKTNWLSPIKEYRFLIGWFIFSARHETLGLFQQCKPDAARTIAEHEA